MTRLNRLALCFVIAPLTTLANPAGTALPPAAPSVGGYATRMSLTAPANSCAYLASVMDRYHRAFFVYDDFLSAGNHFFERGLMCNAGDEASVPPMDEAWSQNPRSGLHCIRCEFKSEGSNWGGWFFLNGALPSGQDKPRLNWGDVSNAGYDLRGATRLTFWAHGENGGEKVKFFAFGIGRNPYTGVPSEPYPDSALQKSTAFIKLTKDWAEYSIDLSGLDLRQVLLGFAWQTKATVNDHRDITFYLDDIQYDLARPDDPRFLVSYETLNSGDDFDIVLRNVAFTYDNAAALLAFLGSGEIERARLVADAFLYAQRHDRYFTDGRLRNAYQGGDLALPPGWHPNGKTGVARIPGWWDKAQGRWLEDATMTGTYAGNMAWAMLALLTYYETAGGEEYLAAAEAMGEWIERHCRDARGAGGYTAGYEGWEPDPVKLMYKSTEHNIDLCAVFGRLYDITGKAAWLERARHARTFVHAMWDPAEGKFWTGTGDDGETVFRDVVPIDVQAWAQLALREDAAPFRKGLEYAESQCMVGRGFDFNQDTDGIWFEGTAQMAVAFACTGQEAKERALVEFLRLSRNASGGMTASDRDAISTGFYLQDGTPWLYYKRLHVGATSWMVFAENRLNPFWMRSPAGGQMAAAAASGASSVTRR